MLRSTRRVTFCSVCSAAAFVGAGLLTAAPAGCTTSESRKPKTYSGYSSEAPRSVGLRATPRKDANYVSPMNRKPQKR